MIELVIDQRRRDLGGFEVGRVLPAAQRRMVGPFAFFDHMGPIEFAPGIPRSVDVRPHPHIGLATVTYLFDGEIMHRDSLGSEQAIRPGEVNWMTAGRGITHSERFERARREGGLTARHPGVGRAAAGSTRRPSLPSTTTAPTACPSTSPEACGRASSPARRSARKQRCARFRRSSTSIGISPRERSAQLEARYPERAAYIVTGTVDIEGRSYNGGQLIVFAPGAPVLFTAIDARRRHAAGRRADRRALCRVEFRLFVAGAHRAGEGGLARRPNEAAVARRSRIHSAAARSRAAGRVAPVARQARLRTRGSASSRRRRSACTRLAYARVSSSNEPL